MNETTISVMITAHEPLTVTKRGFAYFELRAGEATIFLDPDELDQWIDALQAAKKAGRPESAMPAPIDFDAISTDPAIDTEPDCCS